MKLQAALDVLSTEAALRVARLAAPSVDILEAGTPLIKQEGLAVVAALKKEFPDKLILADMKTMDAGELEAKLAFDAGADLLTVLGVAHDGTVRGALREAVRRGRGVVADMIGCTDVLTRARELEALGVVAVEMHCGLDEQALGLCSWDAAQQVISNTHLAVSIAGGLNKDSIGGVRRMGAAVAVAGSSIYGATDPGEAARALAEAAR